MIEVGFYDHLLLEEYLEVIPELPRPCSRVVVSPLRIVYHHQRIVHILPQILRLLIKIVDVVFQMLEIRKR